jgi:hypothetical protein
LHFKNKEGQTVTMPCDRYRTWQGNVRALMLTLRALRAVDRYGATATGEQYRGWTALPGAGMTTPTLSTNQASELLVRWSNDNPSESLVASLATKVRDNIESARVAFRVAMKRSHPDAQTGGNNQKFTLVQEAGRILAAHHGVSKL